MRTCSSLPSASLPSLPLHGSTPHYAILQEPAKKKRKPAAKKAPAKYVSREATIRRQKRQQSAAVVHSLRASCILFST